MTRSLAIDTDCGPDCCQVSGAPTIDRIRAHVTRHLADGCACEACATVRRALTVFPEIDKYLNRENGEI